MHTEECILFIIPPLWLKTSNMGIITIPYKLRSLTNILNLDFRVCVCVYLVFTTYRIRVGFERKWEVYFATNFIFTTNKIDENITSASDL